MGFTRRALLILIGLSVVAGCSDAPAPQASPVPARTSSATPLPVRTLPPTWTPTFTPTPLPPSPTPTITLTPSSTPTLDPAIVCDDLEMLSLPTDGIRVDYGGRIAFSWRGAPSSVTVRVAVWGRDTGEGVLVEWSSEDALNMPVEMDYLTGAGVYDWSFSLYDATLGDLCVSEGWFERLTVEESSTPTPTPTSTPTATPPITPATTGEP